eukprot:scaffold1060_cov246-Pinguiococcus_pyrenoidosus.AAC.4
MYARKKPVPSVVSGPPSAPAPSAALSTPETQRAGMLSASSPSSSVAAKAFGARGACRINDPKVRRPTCCNVGLDGASPPVSLLPTSLERRWPIAGDIFGLFRPCGVGKTLVGGLQRKFHRPSTAVQSATKATAAATVLSCCTHIPRHL